MLMLALSAQAEAPVGSDAHLVEMVVAQVDSTAITLSEVMAQTRLVLLRSRGLDVARTAVISRPLMLAVLRSMVHRELLLGEVRRLNLQAPQEEVDKTLAAIRRQFPTPEDYERFMDATGFRDPVTKDTSLLSGVVRGELQAERYLDLRVRLNVAILEGEMRRCYQANEQRFFGRTFAEMRPRIELELREQREQKALASLIEQLEGRSKIRFAPGFEPPPPAREDEEGVGFVCPE